MGEEEMCLAVDSSCGRRLDYLARTYACVKRVLNGLSAITVCSLLKTPLTARVRLRPFTNRHNTFVTPYVDESCEFLAIGDRL